MEFDEILNDFPTKKARNVLVICDQTELIFI